MIFVYKGFFLEEFSVLSQPLDLSVPIDSLLGYSHRVPFDYCLRQLSCACHCRLKMTFLYKGFFLEEFSVLSQPLDLSVPIASLLGYSHRVLFDYCLRQFICACHCRLKMIFLYKGFFLEEFAVLSQPLNLSVPIASLLGYSHRVLFDYYWNRLFVLAIAVSKLS